MIDYIILIKLTQATLFDNLNSVLLPLPLDAMDTLVTFPGHFDLVLLFFLKRIHAIRLFLPFSVTMAIIVKLCGMHKNGYNVHVIEIELNRLYL